MENINDINLDEFPYLDNLDVQKTETNFDYNLWGASTQLYLSHVPAIWNSEYKHTVKFETKAEKDAFFKTNAPIKLSTSFPIKPDGTIRLQIPYNNLINFNYIVAVYPDLPVPGNDVGDIRKEYYYFIEDCKMIAANTTELVLSLDVWSTYIDDINVNNMRLQRGHYPQTLTTVENYLANPLQNRLGIGTTDVTFGDLCKVGAYHSYDLLNGSTQYVVVATTANPTLFSGYTTTFNGGTNMERGIYYFAVPAANWETFVNNTMANTPAFFQTIIGLMMVNSNYVTIGAQTITFNDVVCYTSIGGKLDAINYTFTKNDFNYDSKYAGLTKLYTFPYAVIECIDQNGNTQLIKYEDMYVGKFALSIFTKMCVGNHTSRAVILNVGGDNTQGSFNLYSFDIPIPSTMVNQSPNNAYMFETKFPRIQQQNDIDTGFNITKNNADVSSAISKRGNDQSKDFGQRNLTASAGVTKLSSWETYVSTQLQNNFMMENASIQEVVDRINKELAVFGAAMGSSAPIAGAGLSSLAGGAAAGLMNPMMIAAALVTATPGILGAFSAPEIYKATWNSGNNVGDEHVYSDAYPLENVTNMDGTNAKKTNISNKLMWDLWLLNYKNSWNQNSINPPSVNDTFSDDSRFGIDYRNKEGQNNDSYTRAETDRVASYNNTLGNANASKSNSETAIQNAINQSNYNNNRSYGAPGDVSVYDGYRNIIQYHIKTQSPDAIKQAGDIFLRYGYAYDGNIQFSSFNVMPKFSFWKVEDVWLDSDKVNNSVIKNLTNILKDGITVWKNPSEVGKIDIYSNN